MMKALVNSRPLTNRSAISCGPPLENQFWGPEILIRPCGGNFRISYEIFGAMLLGLLKYQFS